jgi:hypothetical protein
MNADKKENAYRRLSAFIGGSGQALKRFSISFQLTTFHQAAR